MFKFLKTLFNKKDKISVLGQCNMCGECCKAIHIYDRGKWLSDEDRLLELQNEDERYKRLVIIGKIQKGYLTLKCTSLGSDGKCKDYATRFDFCNSYPNPLIFKNGARLGDDCGFFLKHSLSFEKVLKKKMKKI